VAALHFRRYERTALNVAVLDAVIRERIDELVAEELNLAAGRAIQRGDAEAPERGVADMDPEAVPDVQRIPQGLVPGQLGQVGELGLSLGQPILGTGEEPQLELTG
jgi:hypothetical protein